MVTSRLKRAWKFYFFSASMYKEKTDKEVVLLPSREPGDSVHSAQYDRQHATDKQAGATCLGYSERLHRM